MNSKTLICLLLCVLAIAYANKSKHENHQIYSSKKFQKVLSNIMKTNEKATPFLQNVKALLQTKQTGYQKIHDIGDNIGSLHNILLADQQADDDQFAKDTKRINDAIAAENQAITDLRTQRQLLRDKLIALRAERAKIENIYQTDRDAYKQRTQTQSQLALVLDELIRQAQDGLVNNPDVPDLDNTNVSQVLAQVKSVGRGRPIEALVQLNSLFDKQNANDIVQRFKNLQNAIYEALSIDTQKEDANLNLYNVLTNNIDNVLIPEAEQQIQAINDQIKVHKANIVSLQAELARITSIYNQTKAERANAINYTSQASVELQKEIDFLNSSGYTVK
ncbi:hypothetical protein TTHERM_00685980 (macronuclear) [Tetrahymena thermophila SB210]|uniref:Uncharacterized protein n=1 Tax=Tetrahymena thermophila (strain SB210) TaxID=312017 RepID=I7MJ15_TETTS|nr:hypothetical protein TTHERM_00685980 [Tetrahymena thermophila SB210]EAS04955.1 hypothetical protein TTHERM_00685980 [Tetrahymena thermophila SB210]|eukprot:XP_001025200.1 hypothetical protein TTHERM_00685980 [Tetrahymena thermophila SB210]